MQKMKLWLETFYPFICLFLFIKLSKVAVSWFENFSSWAPNVDPLCITKKIPKSIYLVWFVLTDGKSILKMDSKINRRVFLKSEGVYRKSFRCIYIYNFMSFFCGSQLECLQDISLAIHSDSTRGLSSDMRDLLSEIRIFVIFTFILSSLTIFGRLVGVAGSLLHRRRRRGETES